MALLAVTLILLPDTNLKLLININQGWSHPLLDRFFIWVSSRSTFSTPLLLLIGLILFLKYKKEGLKLWGLFLLMLGLGDILGNLLKGIISQPRPCAVVFESILQPLRETGKSCGAMTTGMPSNHALNFFLTASFLGLALKSWRWAAPFFLIAITVGLSRIYLGAHYPSQVLVGACLGSCLGLISALIVQQRCRFMHSIHSLTPPQNPL